MVKSMAISDNLKRGTVELSVLTLLQKGDMYGYEISQQLFEQSGELYQIQEIVSDSLSFGWKGADNWPIGKSRQKAR